MRERSAVPGRSETINPSIEGTDAAQGYAPEAGPRLLFFSGGTAINGLAKRLKHYSHNTIHLVTPFDSGGSSAALRAAFDMPAVGDLRSRMMALADEEVEQHGSLYLLLTHRLSKAEGQGVLREQLEMMSRGEHLLTAALAQPLQGLLCHYLRTFLDAAPADFDYRGASIGNLILTGGYLHDHRDLTPITLLLNELLDIRGIVAPITQEVAQLRVSTESGRQIVGQHLMTGKEVAALNERITKVELEYPVGSLIRLRHAERDLIRSAQLIVFPPGSFFSSLIVNLLPQGVGQAVMESSAPKVFIPNLGSDPELEGLSLRQQIEELQAYVCADAGGGESAIDTVLTDSTLHAGVDVDLRDWLKRRNIRLIDTDLAANDRSDRYDDQKLSQALLQLV